MKLRWYAALSAALSVAAPAFAWDIWPSANFVAQNNKQCPQVALSRLSDGALETEIDRSTLGMSEARWRVVRSRVRQQCAAETAGFACEEMVTIRSLDGWRLTAAFVAGLCHRYKTCAEPRPAERPLRVGSGH